MSKDDYYVIVYRLLKYLYDCLKKSKRPDADVLAAGYFGVGNEYWEYIIRNIFTDGYVEGCALVPIMGRVGKGVKIGPNFCITPKGILYIEENSAFQKIRGHVKDIADLIPIL